VTEEVTNPEYEYGFYDSDPEGRHMYDHDWKPEPQSNPVIFWYVFGILTHQTAESAEHTARKSTWGEPVIVRRIKGQTEWEVVQS
jgi:hypothetical protein